MSLTPVSRTVLTVIAAFAVAVPLASSSELTCPAAATLEELVDCIVTQMPHEGEGCSPPGTGELAALRLTISAMLAEPATAFVSPELTAMMELRSFLDQENRRLYLVLMEIADADGDGTVDRGIGTFIVDPGARRELNHAAPHPITDIDTQKQAIRIFKATRSRAFTMAGTTRNAGPAASACQPSYQACDAAHNIGTLFFVATEELHGFYGDADFYQIQWHGFREEACPASDVYISHGDRNVTPPPDDVVHTLRGNVVAANPSWVVTIDGEGCTYDGWSNTSGRLLNGVARSQVCDTPAAALSGRFIHIEQERQCRSATDWIPALESAFPARVSRRPIRWRLHGAQPQPPQPFRITRERGSSRPQDRSSMRRP